MTDPWFADDLVTVYHGDCLDILRTLDDASVDAVVTDPPYGLVFMGKHWDDHVDNTQFGKWCQQWAAECLRVLKPGGHMLAFGGTRTWHRLASAVEDAGFEIRDSVAWIYAQGFPKSLDVSKAIDKAAGVERPQVLVPTKRGNLPEQAGDIALGATGMTDVSAPATPDAQRWQGWGTALKPAHEPIVVARKPLAGTVAANVLTYGTGALNIDACRIGTDGEVIHTPQSDPTKRSGVVGRDLGISNADTDKFRSAQAASIERTNTLGRWPANVVLDPAAAQELDRQSGHESTRPAKAALDGTGSGSGNPASGVPFVGGVASVGYLDSGGASRYFYVSREDEPTCPTTNAKCADHPQPPDTTNPHSSSADGSAASASPAATTPTDADEMAARFRYEPKAPTAERPRDGQTAHPTVKPLDLMRWLVRLVTPKGGVVLDPFLGSGTTAEACVIEGFRCVGVERESDYLPLIRARLTKPIQPDLFG